MIPMSSLVFKRNVNGSLYSQQRCRHRKSRTEPMLQLSAMPATQNFAWRRCAFLLPKKTRLVTGGDLERDVLLMYKKHDLQ